jgi:hypothetical protein
VQLGDLYDLYSFTKFPRSYSVYTPNQELTIGRRDAEKFWSTLNICAPKAKRFQLAGNHDARLVKKALADAPELEQFALEGITGLMRFDGVETYTDSKEMLEIEGVYYTHGFMLKLGDHAREFRVPIVCGHTHQGGVAMVKTEKEIVWELNAGYVANRHAVPLSYAAQRRFSKHTLGVGLVTPMAPVFIPLNTEESR